MKKRRILQYLVLGAMAVLYILLYFLFFFRGLSVLGQKKVMRLGSDFVFLLVSSVGYGYLCIDNRVEDNDFRRYREFFILLFFVFWCSIVSVFLGGDATYGSLSFYALNLSYLGSILLAWGTYYFILHHYKLDKKDVLPSRILADVSFFITVPLLLFNIVTRKLFALDNTGELIKKHYYLVFSIPMVLSYLLGVFKAFRSDMTSKDKHYFAVSFLIPAAGLVIGSFFRSATIPCSSGLLDFLLIYVRLFSQRTNDVAVAQIKLEETTQEEKETEQKILLSQMQPHFIFNTLSTIAALTRKDPETASAITKDFASYLNDNLEILSSNPIVLFSKELEHIRKYVNIQKVRFGEELTVLYDIGPEEFPVPALSIQPMVENAVIHGIVRGKMEAGTVKVSTREDKDNWFILIEDDGIGFDPKKNPSDGRVHVGLKNSRERILSLCGGAMEVSSVPGKGTTITISIPKKESVNE